MNISERKIIDLLVNEFWRLGYFTLSRRMGTYLPEPTAIGKFNVDVVGRQKDRYAVGIILNQNDLNDVSFIEKIRFLASRHSRLSKKPVILLIGVPVIYYKHVKHIINDMEEELKRNIRLIKISENKEAVLSDNREQSEVLFS